MFFPIGDDDSSSKTFPIVTIFIIAANLFVFYFFQKLGSNDRFTYAFSLVPKELLSGHDIATAIPINNLQSGKLEGIIALEITPIPIWLTIFTSMFMHAGLVHIIGNMLYLWIFGDNIETYFGHIKFLTFYLFSGIIAAVSHIAFNSDSFMPMMGASGAIAGVLGAYMALFPRRDIRVFIWGFIRKIPASIVLGMWFIFQVLEGSAARGLASGIAYVAHIGGFLFGFLAVKILKKANY